MSKSPEAREGEIQKRVILYLFYHRDPEEKIGRLLLEFKPREGLEDTDVCLIPKQEIKKGETPLITLRKEMKERGIKIIKKTKLQIISDKGIEYHPFLILDWKLRNGEKSPPKIPVWVERESTGETGIRELRAKKLLPLFIEVWKEIQSWEESRGIKPIKAEEERKEDLLVSHDHESPNVNETQ